MITTILIDIGGVLLTNGWDRHERAKAIEKFQLEPDEFAMRHEMAFEEHEVGRISLDQYLDRVVCHRPRTFTKEEFKDFMFAQSQMLPDMADLVKELKAKHNLFVAAVSNEGRELQEYRIKQFGLNEYIDAFLISSFVGWRKPGETIFKIALDVTQSAPQHAVFIDNLKLSVEVSATLGINGVHHEDVPTTRAKLAALGLD